MNKPKTEQQKEQERLERRKQLGITDTSKLPTLVEWRKARDTAIIIFNAKESNDVAIQCYLDEYELSYHSDEDKEQCKLDITNHLLSLKFPGNGF